MSVGLQRKPMDILRDDKEPIARKTTALCEIIRSGAAEVFPGVPEQQVTALLVSLRNAINKTPSVATCTPVSVVNVLTQCAQNGWVLGGAMQQAHIVPFGSEATLIPGWRGLVDLVMRSGQMAKPPTPQAVYLGESFAVRMIDGELQIDHGYDQGNKYRIRGDDSAITNVYVVGVLKNGARQRYVMAREEVDAHKEQHAKGWTKKDSAWQTNWKEQAFKTCISQMIRRGLLPMSVQDKQLVDSAARCEAQIIEATPTDWLSDDHPTITHDPSQEGIVPGDAAE